MNDTKTRPVLSIKKTAPVTAAEPSPLPHTPTLKPPKPQQPPKERNRAFKCLQAHWPDLFDIKQPTPLQIGIRDPIVEHLEQAGELFTAKQIGRALSEHCSRSEYLKALTNAPHRVGLHGELSPISELDRQGAMNKLKARCKAQKKRDEELKAKNAAQ